MVVVNPSSTPNITPSPTPYIFLHPAHLSSNIPLGICSSFDPFFLLIQSISFESSQLTTMLRSMKNFIQILVVSILLNQCDHSSFITVSRLLALIVAESSADTERSLDQWSEKRNREILFRRHWLIERFIDQWGGNWIFWWLTINLSQASMWRKTKKERLGVRWSV